MKNNFDLEQLLSSLRQTVAWAERRIESPQKMGEQFRHSKIAPVRPLFPVSWDGKDDQGISHAVIDSFSSTFNQVNLVIKQRQELLDPMKITFDSKLFGGKLLVYEPSMTMVDNISGIHSGGFFDNFDAPPWDLWVAYLVDWPAVQALADNPKTRGLRPDFLISYVPASFLSLAERGRWANATACLYWLDQASVEKNEILNESFVAAQRIVNERNPGYWEGKVG